MRATHYIIIFCRPKKTGGGNSMETAYWRLRYGCRAYHELRLRLT